jgi:hypothetical protein
MTTIEVEQSAAALIQTLKEKAAAQGTSLDALLQPLLEEANGKQSEEALRNEAMLNDPAYTMTFRDYLSLSGAERRDMALDLQERYRDWLGRQLDLHRAAWIAVIGGQVVESSPRLDDYPTPERLMKLGTEYNRIPFVFSRPPLFEEISWSVLPGNDFYPTLALTIGAGDWVHDQLLAQGRDLIADFDTGSPYLFLSWDWLLSAGLVTATPVDFPQAWHHLGRQYVYYTRFMRVGIADGSGTRRSLEVACECVEDWDQSPLCEVNPARLALAGRNLLLGFPLTVELNGAERRTVVARC